MRYERDQLDHTMIELAMRHGTVLVERAPGREVPATLIGWQAKAGRRRARVQYVNGSSATVCGSMVRPVPAGPR
jgi:hypothetical protein